MAKKKGVFCLETASWEPGIRDKSSVEHMLRLLETGFEVPYLHFDGATREEFQFYLKKWAGPSFRKSHPILYLAFHGDSGAIRLGGRRENWLNLSELAELLDGSCRGRVIHFGTCSTLDIHGREINTFLDQTDALAVCGFKTDVDWLPSAAFEMLVMGGLQDVPFTRPGMRTFEGDLNQTAHGLFRTLGFRMKVRNG